MQYFRFQFVQCGVDEETLGPHAGLGCEGLKQCSSYIAHQTVCAVCSVQCAVCSVQCAVWSSVEQCGVELPRYRQQQWRATHWDSGQVSDC